MSNTVSPFTARRSLKALTALGAIMALAGTAHAQSTRTDAGRTVTNTFTLDYDVNDTPQTQITNEDGTPGDPDGPTIFTVDRLIDLTVTEVNSPQTVAPGAAAALLGGGALDGPPGTQPAVLSYTVQNNGNDDQAYSFNLDSPTGTFVAEDLRIFYEDAAGNFIELDSVALGTGATTEITEDIPAGGTFNVFVVANIPADAEDGEFDDIILTAETRDPADWAFDPAATTAGTLTTSVTVGADTNNLVGAAQNVFADGAGDTDAAADGLFSDTGQFIVATPNVSGTKDVEVVSTDGSNCPDFTVPTSPNEFSVSGACVEYVITVSNAPPVSGGAPIAVTNIAVADILPPELTFVAAVAEGFDTTAPAAAPTPSPALPTGAATDCDGTSATCLVRFEGGTIAAPASPTSPAVEARIRIRALVK